MPSCPDQGTCHHECIAGCYRVLACAPFEGHNGGVWSEEDVHEAESLRTAEQAVVIIDDADLRENLIASIAAHADTIAELVELQNEYMAVAPFRDAFHGLQREAGDLRETLFEQEQEITRHHRDFERWEAMAARGFTRAAEWKRVVEVLLPVAEMYLEAFDDEDRMTMVEALRYTEVRDTVAELRAKEDA